MRATLTIDPDVASALELARKANGGSFKDIVNTALRRGLHEMRKPKSREPFRTQTYDAGEPFIKNLDNIGEVLAILEGEDYK
jgi:hypothetical protein